METVIAIAIKKEGGKNHHGPHESGGQFQLFWNTKHW